MTFSLNPLLIVTFLPLAGFIVIALLKKDQKREARLVALVTSLLTFIVSLWVLAAFKTSSGDMQLEYNIPWFDLGGMPIGFHLGLDGLSLLMLLLTTFLTPLAILSTWNAVQERVRGFMMFFMLLEMGMIGVFLSIDLVLFYVFWEFTLVPMYFLIGMWGGERRVYAAVKFFLFTMAGSLLMLVAIFFIGLQAGTFSLPELVVNRALFASAGIWLFLAFAIAFAIKVPMWPLHTWLPDAHVEAPTAGSVILAGVLLKMGSYGFLRFNLPLFPEITVKAAPWMAALAVIGIIYGAMVSFAQKDMKKLVAYSSVSHLGFVMLGIFALNAEGISGAILQMVNHGLSTGALFLMVGMLYERTHTRQMADYGGVLKVLPAFAILSLIITLSSMGLPGLNGFVGEFTILLGAYKSTVIGSPWFAGVATMGVILAAVYLLHMYEKVFLGKVQNDTVAKLEPVSIREFVVLIPLLVMIFWIGLYPKPFFELLNPTVNQLLEVFTSAGLF